MANELKLREGLSKIQMDRAVRESRVLYRTRQFILSAGDLKSAGAEESEIIVPRHG
jgi:hypothetical protein